MVTINYRDGRPFYEQVKDDLRRLVVSFAAPRERENDPRREELLTRLKETARELTWLGMTPEEICAEIGGMTDEHD